MKIKKGISLILAIVVTSILFFWTLYGMLPLKSGLDYAASIFHWPLARYRYPSYEKKMNLSHEFFDLVSVKNVPFIWLDPGDIVIGDLYLLSKDSYLDDDLLEPVPLFDVEDSNMDTLTIIRFEDGCWVKPANMICVKGNGDDKDLQALYRIMLGYDYNDVHVYNWTSDEGLTTLFSLSTLR